MIKHNRFERSIGHSGKFKCAACGRMTRNTGDNASVGLCPLCYEECEIENEYADMRITKEEYEEKMVDLEKRRINP